MWQQFTMWLSFLAGRKTPVRRRQTFRPSVEWLGERIAPAVITWNGQGTDWGTAAD
jgi:hypothetical protein